MNKSSYPSVAFRKNFTKKNLRTIYNDRIKKSGAIGLDRIKPVGLEDRLEDELDVIVRKVGDGTYKFTPYKEKLISKGAASLPRQISIPTARDRIVLRALCDTLAEVFPKAKLTLPQTVIESLILALQSGKFVEYAKIDLEKFYPSISHSLIKESISKRVKKNQIEWLIESAIKTPTASGVHRKNGLCLNSHGVPQGLAISNILAEISLSSIDDKFKVSEDFWYQRYVDDILILAPQGDAENIAKNIIGELISLGLSPHPIGVDSKSKTGFLNEVFCFLGYEVNKNEILIRKESILRFESSIAKIFTAYRHKLKNAKNSKDKQRALGYCIWKLNLRITGCIFKGKRLGWVAYYSKITSTSQLRAVNHTVRKLITRFGLEKEITPKSLIKTYYEFTKGDKASHKYIPNFDGLSVRQKRDYLAMWYGDKALSMPEVVVLRNFEMKINKATRELEEDIAQVS